MKGWGCIGMLAVLAVLVGAAFYLNIQIGPTYSVCRSNDEMPSAEQAEIAEPALEVVRAMKSGDANAVYQMMSADARAVTTREALTQAIHNIGGASADSELSVRNVFRIFSLGVASGSAICSTPSGYVFPARGGGMRTAFAEVVEPVNGGERTWIIWLERDDNAWRVRAFHTVVSAIAGRSGEDLWELARDEKRRGHLFNATILYDVAQSALSRGPNMQAAQANDFRTDQSALQRHPDLPGAPPLTFRLGEKQFPIRWLTVTGAGDNSFMLIIDQEGIPVSDAEAPTRNRELIDALNEHRSEWREVFDAIAVGYPTDDRNTVWRTVYSSDTGYFAEPEAP